MDTQQISYLQDKLGADLKRNVNLFPYMTMRTGAVADCFTEAKSRGELIGAVQAAIQAGAAYRIIGGGSNMAMVHNTVDFFVIKNSYSDLKVLEDRADYAAVRVSSGYPMAMLVSKSVENGWEGFEYHKGLPGSVGGAVYMNSKWTRPWKYTGDCLVSASLLDRQGKEKDAPRDYFRFAYDYSYLQETKETVVDIIFRFRKEKPEILATRADEALSYRKKTQPFGVATAGCFFRNISKEDQAARNLPTTSAGFLIDQSGMKGAKKGGFEVSQIHANFIINTGKSGAPDDLLQLVGEIKDKVREKFGIELHEEVEAL